MIKERLAELLSRKLSGEATPAELQELEHWLQAHPEDQYFADLLFNYWTGQSPATETTEASSDQHFAHILQMAGDEQEDSLPAIIAPKRKTIHLAKRWTVAASVAAIIALSLWLVNKKGSAVFASNTMAKKEVVAQKGARTKMILPDGTQVWLNSDSKLQYDQSFNDTIREVTLEGEAYFDVARNPKRPFIVHTSRIDIRVLGTAFNVKSYEQEKTIETTLIHGLVQVIKKDEPQRLTLFLRPKEKLVFNKQEAEFDKEMEKPTHPGTRANVPGIAVVPLAKGVADTSLKETAWVYNRLDFEGDTFSELAVKMERWFNVQITFKNEEVAASRLRGAFEDESLEDALKALQLITTFTYKINNNEIEINK